MAELEKQNRNRIWARFIKNAFAPVFKSQKRFDFVVGNPPWVNWESLADEYRAETKRLWRDYGFFTQHGYSAVCLPENWNSPRSSPSWRRIRTSAPKASWVL